MVLGDGAHVQLDRRRAADGSSRFGSIVVPRALLDGRGSPAADFDDGLQVDTWITLAVVGVIVAYAAMSLVNALVAALTARRRELALLRLAGATRRQIRRDARGRGAARRARSARSPAPRWRSPG